MTTKADQEFARDLLRHIHVTMREQGGMWYMLPSERWPDPTGIMTCVRGWPPSRLKSMILLYEQCWRDMENTPEAIAGRIEVLGWSMASKARQLQKSCQETGIQLQGLFRDLSAYDGIDAS